MSGRSPLPLQGAARARLGAGRGAGWSFFRHNLTQQREKGLPPGKGAAAAMMLAPNGTRTAAAAWAARVTTPGPRLSTLPLPCQSGQQDGVTLARGRYQW